LEVPARTDDEQRWLAIGKIGAKHWSAVFVRRDHKVRIISVRRARKQEIEHYEGHEFEQKFDAGEDMSDHIDWSKARRPNVETKRVNVDFPTWVVESLDQQAQRLGVTRQALIKLWIAERLQ
jgi:hypothetical protein